MLKFGDFVKTEAGNVFRVVHVPASGEYLYGLSNQAGSWLQRLKRECTALPDYIDFDGPKKPEPVYDPWTFETMPIGVKCRPKDKPECRRLALPATATSVDVSGTIRSYDELFASYEQLDGGPCGQLKEGK